MKQEIKQLLALYGLEKEVKSVHPFGSGHIHQTYRVEARSGDYILQNFNQTVFPYPEQISNNLALLQSFLEQHPLPFQLPLPIKNKEGALLTPFQEGMYRLFPFVEGTSVDQVEEISQAHLAAKAFGTLIDACLDLDPKQFTEVIPGFHDLSMRFQQFQSSLQKQSKKAAPEVEALIEFYQTQGPLVEQYLQYKKTLPLRVTHNDTKINNLIFEKDFSKVNALIDLDTVMPGFAFYDFGDLVRTAACTEDESSQHWQAIAVDMGKYKALLEGFVEAFDGKLGEQERKSLPFGGEMMTCIMGLRFLTDYLNGNVYYAINYPEQNFHRAKNQMLLLQSLQEKRKEIEEILG